MNHTHVEAKILKQQGNSTDLLIRAGDSVVQVTYAELAPCEFPVWARSPVNVEVPPNGVKHHVAGVSSESFVRKHADGLLPNTIKFPVYARQTSSTLEAFNRLPELSPRSNSSSVALSREPLIAVGITARGSMLDGKQVETHAVLPIWHDGTAVMVTLNWYDGEPSEGTPNPEWYLRGTEGMPLAAGLRTLQEYSLLPASLSDCRYSLHMSPCKIGETVLDGPGQPTTHKIWQRAWQFTDVVDFQVALGRVCDQLLGLNDVQSRSLAGQQA